MAVHRRFTQADLVAMAAMRRKGMSSVRIAACMGCSSGAVQRKLRSMGIMPPPLAYASVRVPDPTPEEIAERCAEIRERKLAKILGRPEVGE